MEARSLILLGLKMWKCLVCIREGRVGGFKRDALMSIFFFFSLLIIFILFCLRFVFVFFLLCLLFCFLPFFFGSGFTLGLRELIFPVSFGYDGPG